MKKILIRSGWLIFFIIFPFVVSYAKGPDDLIEKITSYPTPKDGWNIYIGSVKLSCDSKHYACVARNENDYCIIYDGKKGKVYDQISADSPIFYPGSGEVFYKAKKGSKWHLVIGEDEQKEYEGIGPIYANSDASRVAYIVARGNKKVVVIDGKESRRYDAIDAKSGVVFSKDSKRYAYAATIDGKISVIDNGKEHKGYDDVLRIVLSPDSSRLVYGVKDENGWFVVVDNMEGKRYRAVADILISPDSQNVAYVARKGSTTRMIVNDDESSSYDICSAGVFSPDSKRFAYLAIREEKWFIVLDGKKGQDFEEIGYLTFSGDSKHFAFTARKDNKWFVVIDGKIQKQMYDSIPYFSYAVGYGDTLVYSIKSGEDWFVVMDGKPGKRYDQVSIPQLSPDNNHMYYMARKDKKWMVVMDGKESKGYDGVSMPRFTPDSKHLAFIVQNMGQWYINIDGKEGMDRFAAFVRGSRLDFDTPTHLSTWVFQFPDMTIGKYEVTIE